MASGNPFRGSASSISVANDCEEPRCTTRDDPVYFCVDCSVRFCNTCWDLVLQHQPGRTARDGIEHERTDFHAVKRLQDIMNPPSSHQTLVQMHNSDEETTWFGITRDANGRPFLEDWETFSSLMDGSPRDTYMHKYPQLVSFVGQTNGGKSTLIKLLIDHQESRQNSSAPSTYPSPVAGASVNDAVPTSADVHLYADPESYFGQMPMLYADCEGLDAGEEPPMGAWSRRNRGSDRNRLVRKFANGRVHALEWATTDQTRTRQFAVTELYPRLLYTFSDVVVFVLRNAKTFQTAALQKLLEWGSASLEKSINQPTLPHAIIAVNATDVNINRDEWNGDRATQNLLASVSNALHPVTGVPEFVKLARVWRGRGKRIDSMVDLVRCYYSSFSVVRIPVKGRYTLLQKQIDELHKTIRYKCNESLRAKQQAKMVSNSEQLNIYIQSAFIHFSQKLERPFDFVEVDMRNHPIALDFGGHILQLALAIQAQPCFKRDGPWLFKKLSDMVASCVLLDCKDRPGPAQDLFKHYEQFFDTALIDFCELYWPCDFKNEKGQQCTNITSRHISKGHQNDKGKIIGTGDYQSSFSYVHYRSEWKEILVKKIHNLQIMAQSSQQGSVSNAMDYVQLHGRNIAMFYQGLGSAASFVSHATCFCCLMEVPEHPLPCGHVLCTQCVKSFGRCSSNKIVYRLDSCPLHPEDHFEDMLMRPCTIRFKPEYAGTRILSLDGGGIRGIVELETLRAIEKHFNGNHTHKIPIKAFFDLIVGTSTGGIISLALAVKNWSLDEAIEQFMDLCNEAFTPREFAGIPGFDHAARINHGSKYKTRPLHKALREALGEGLLFGGVKNEMPECDVKVAVTSTDETGKKAIVISNYSRNSEDIPNWDFHRPSDPRRELKVWQAAAATSAAAPFFKAYRNEQSGRTYYDGAFYNNNPVRVAHQERKLLWPDVANKSPDIFLSIGTGSSKRIAKQSERLETTQSPSRDNAVVRRPTHKPFANWRQMFTILQSRFDSILDAESSWKEFYQDRGEREKRRYIRLNPRLKYEIPRLDDKILLPALRRDVKDSLTSTNDKLHIRRIVGRLVSSSFYYERISNSRADVDGRWSCKGRICCKFEDGTSYLRGLGEFFQQNQGHNFQPFFEIEEVGRAIETRKIVLSVEAITAMVARAVFNLAKPDDIVVSSKIATTTIYLNLRADGEEAPERYPISGFPRDLMLEQEQKPPSLPPRPALGRNSGSMKRQPDIPASERLCASSSSHGRSTSQPDVSLRNLVAGEREAWDSDRPRSVPLEPGSAANQGATLGSGLTRILTGKRSFAQIFNPSQRPRTDTAVTSPSTSTLHSTEEEEQEKDSVAAANPDPVVVDDTEDDEIQRAIEESIREEERRQARQQDYILGPSHAWHNTIPEYPLQPHSPFDPYPPTSSRNNHYALHQTNLPPARRDSTDEELQRAMEESMRIPVPTIQLHQNALGTPQEELQLALDMSLYDY